jgi:FKBP-type peptidyl-prolyl cis-trans isomerase
VGHAVASDLQLQTLEWTDAQFEAFLTDLRASFRGQRLTLDDTTQAQFNAIGNRISAAQARGEPANAAAGSPPDHLEQARKQFKLQQAASGLLFRIGRYGAGPRPTPGDLVVISFKATSPDASGDIPQLAVNQAHLRVADLMPGLAEAVQMLALDGSGLFLLPPGLSFRDGRWPDGVKPGTPLLFSVELHDIEPAEAAP